MNMILDEKFSINIKSRNIDHYKQFFNNIKINDIVSASLDQLHSGANIEINVSCDICGNVKKMMYVRYKRYLGNDDKYYCCNCKWIKINNTKKEKYNNINYNNREKFKKTCIINMGVDNPMKNENIKEKNKIICLEKYGVKNIFENEDIKNKIKNVKKEKYDDENYNNRNKSIETLKKNYNVDVTFKFDVIKDRSKSTLIYKYGVDNVFKNGKIRKNFTYEKMINWYDKIKLSHKDISFIDVNFIKKEFLIKCEKDHIYNISFGLFYNRNRKDYELPLH